MNATGKKKKMRPPLRFLEYTAQISFLVLAFLLLHAGCNKAEPSQAEAAWVPTALDAGETPPSDGREVIRRHIAFMDAQQELITEAFVTYEALQDSGQKLHFDMLQQITLRRPDKLHWKILRDDSSVDTAWFSNGRFTLHKQPANLWGQVEGPDNVADLVDFLAEEYAVNAPFRDLLAGKAEELWLSDDITSVVYVGEAWVEGAWSEHVAFRKPGFDFEIWVRKGPEPFLSKLTVVFTDAPGQPTYLARFRKWATSIPDDTIFDFDPPPGSERIEVVPVFR